MRQQIEGTSREAVLVEDAHVRPMMGFEILEPLPTRSVPYGRVDPFILRGKSFAEYVDYLAANGYVPPNGKAWVDHIRQKGNEATHEIPQATPADAEELIAFLEMLLRFIYDFPSRVPHAPSP